MAIDNLSSVTVDGDISATGKLKGGTQASATGDVPILEEGATTPVIPVSIGGTGASALTNGKLLVGQGTGSITAAPEAGTATQGIYINSSGTPTAMTYSVSANVPSDAVFTDTKNTAGSTASTGTKLFLVGATEQSTNPATNSNANCYIGTDNCLYSGGSKVLTSAPVTSVNTKTGAVTLSASDVGALPDSTPIPTVNNATLTIKFNNASVATFTANASTNSTAEINETTLSKGTTVGTGNAVTDVAVSGHTVTLTKGATFLTEHQSLSGYAPLASPAFTGTPTAPTATAGTNTTQIATTAFVATAISNIPTPMQFKGSVGTSGTITTLPAASSANTGYVYKAITAATTPVVYKVGDTLVSDGTTWVVIPSGDEPSGTVTSVATGAGLTGGPVTGSGTLKANLNSETSVGTIGTGGVVAVGVDANGKLAVALGTAAACNTGTSSGNVPVLNNEGKLTVDTTGNAATATTATSAGSATTATSAGSATNASYASFIGTSSSHPAIGSTSQTVYVDSNGQIQAGTTLGTAATCNTGTSNGNVPIINSSGLITVGTTGNAATATSASSATTAGSATNDSAGNQISTYYVPKSGTTMTGVLTAQNNTSYTTKQVRNITLSTSAPSGGSNGDIWLVYDA